MKQAKISITVTNNDGVVVSAQIAGIAVSEGLASMRRWMETQRILVLAPDPDPEPAVAGATGPAPPEPAPVFRPMYKNEAHMVLTHTTKLLHVLITESPDALTKAELEDINARSAALVAKQKVLCDGLNCD